MVKIKKIISLLLLTAILMGSTNQAMAAVLVTVTLDNPAVDTIETVEDKLAEQNTNVIAGLEQGKKMLLERLEQAATTDEREKIQNLIAGYDKMIAEYTVYKKKDVKSQKITAGIVVSDRMANLLAAAVLCNRVIDYPVSALLLQP
ncbi:MAG: hypothetical protein IKU46_10405 [Peptococcaceae bacterium]|nr:hypothetical protein [Peptococcaceae bacterium]